MKITDEMLDDALSAFDDVYDGENWRNAILAAIAAVAPTIVAAELDVAIDVCEEWANNGFPQARLIAKDIRSK